MPPPLLVDLDRVDAESVVLTREQIYDRLLPQRFEFSVLDAVCMVDREARLLVAYADIRTDDWWVRGHIPGRPLLPGILMLEMAAQGSAIGAKLLVDHVGFVGFGRVDGCKFREAVAPPARIYILIDGTDYRPRRIVSHTQGVVDGKLVFEAKVTGLTMR